MTLINYKKSAMSCDTTKGGHCPLVGKLVPRGLHRRIHRGDAEADRIIATLSGTKPAPNRIKPRSEPAGVGTELKTLLESRYGIKVRKNCECNQRAQMMNNRGIDWCERNLETIVGWLRDGASSRVWMQPLVKMFGGTVDRLARSIVEEAIRSAKEKRSISVTEQPVSQDSASGPTGSGLSFAVAVTTAPRKTPTLDQTLASLLRTGFDRESILISAEPQAGLSSYARSFEVHENAERLGCWRNYVLTLKRLLKTDAEALLVVQDDVVFCRNVRAMLERDLWPSPRTGVVSVYSPDANGYEQARDFYGYKLIMQRNLIGACTMVFTRQAAEHAVARAKTGWKGRVRGRVKNPLDKKAVDAWVGHTMRAGRYDVYFIVPSLVQHVGATSSVGHKGLTGLRVSARFPGVDADALEVIPQRIPRADGRGNPIDTEAPDVRDERVTAVIPAHECFDLTRKCLVHLGRSEQEISVIYVDNGSRDETVRQVEQVAEDQGLELTVLRNRENRGFSAAINQGLEAVPEGHYALLLNNDCFLRPDAITRMLTRLNQHDRIGAINPTDVHSRVEQSVTYRDRLAFYATLVRPEALQNVGLLDTADEFAAGLGADDDWCNRARRAGWHLAVAHDAKAKHLHKQSFKRLGIDRRSLQRRAKAYLKRKWRGK